MQILHPGIYILGRLNMAPIELGAAVITVFLFLVTDHYQRRSKIKKLNKK